MLSARNINNNQIFFDDYRLISDSDFEVEHARTLIEPGDVLVTIVGTIGRVAVVPEGAPKFSLQRSVAVLKPYEINSKYLAYALGSPKLQQWLIDNAKGTAQRGVYLKTLGSAQIPIAPLNEQVRIVDKLEELLSDLDAGVAELKTAQKKLEQYRQSILKSAVSGSLTADWRKVNSFEESSKQLLELILEKRKAKWKEKQIHKFSEQEKSPPKGWENKYPEPVEPGSSDFMELPKGWVWASLDMLGDIVSGVAKGTRRNNDVQVYEVPYLRVANVQRGFFNLSEVKTILATRKEISELTLQSGDILFNEGGDRDKLGRGWVWRDEVSDCIHQNHVFRMRLFHSELSPELISHHGNTFGKKWFQAAGKQTTNLASINLTMLRMFPVPLAPASEQREIMFRLDAKLESLDHQVDAVERALKQASAQRKNILKKAFSGQLLFQNGEDEPADALLMRIHSERERWARLPKTRKIKAKEEVVVVVVAKTLAKVLAEASDWLSAQEAFGRCGVTEGTDTDRIEELFAELRELDKSGKLECERLGDYDKIRLKDD